MIGNGTYLKLVFISNHLCRTVIDGHGSLRKSVFLLKFRVHQKQWLAILRRAFLQSLLEKITRTLEFGAPIAFRELGQIDIPEFECDWEGEKLNSTFVNLEALLKVLVLF
jgi:hypothetical protein